MKTKLHLQNVHDQNTLPSAKQFQQWVDASNTKFENAEACIRIVSSDEMQEHNFEYRKKNKPTNVLSFAYAADDNFIREQDGSLYLGDILICPDIVEAEAQAQKKALYDHYAHLSIHGMLHLLGYDHQKTDEANIMEALEIEILQTFNINNPYQVSL